MKASTESSDEDVVRSFAQIKIWLEQAKRVLMQLDSFSVFAKAGKQIRAKSHVRHPDRSAATKIERSN